jgi:hypothetical protein
MNDQITSDYLNEDPPSIQNARMNLTQESWRYVMKWWFT